MSGEAFALSSWYSFSPYIDVDIYIQEQYFTKMIQSNDLISLSFFRWNGCSMRWCDCTPRPLTPKGKLGKTFGLGTSSSPRGPTCGSMSSECTTMNRYGETTSTSSDRRGSRGASPADASIGWGSCPLDLGVGFALEGTSLWPSTRSYWAIFYASSQCPCRQLTCTPLGLCFLWELPMGCNWYFNL